MRALFSTTAGAGHFGPMIPIAQACVAAGHLVAVAAPAGFAANVQAAGLTHLPFPDVPPDQLGAVFARLPTMSREEADRVVVAEVFGRLDAQAALPTLLGTVSDWRPDIVVRDPCEFGSLVAAIRHDVPQVQVAISLGRFLELKAESLDAPLRELESMGGVDLRGAERLLATPTLSSVPPTLDGPNGPAGGVDPDVRGRVWRYRGRGQAPGEDLPAPWGDPSAPLVYVSFGSVAASVGPFREIYPAIVEALGDLPIRVMLTTGTGYDLESLAPLPANTWATDWWPQEAVMAVCSAMIGHGGFGTTMTALAAGVPQLVMPLFASDQFLNAERVEAVGAGRQLVGGMDRVPEVPALLLELLGERRYVDAARGLAAEMAALPDVATTVDVLLDLAGPR